MKQLRRRHRRPADKRRSAFLATQDSNVLRRTLITERLEDRSMMAADWTYSDYWNADRPTDVNADGYTAPIDALVVINELNNGGSRQLSSNTFAGASGGEGEDSAPTYYYDVDNDGHLSPLDALIVINGINNPEGEGEMELVRYYIQPVAVGGNTTITTLNEGQDFELRVLVQDRRPTGNGVFAGYLDILTDTSKLDVYIPETQHIVLEGNPQGGTFTLTFNGQTTDPIAFDGTVDGDKFAIASQIEAELAELTSIGAGNVRVAWEKIDETETTPAVPNRWAIQFKGTLGNIDQPLLTGNASGLTGGTNPSIVVTETARGGDDNDPDAVRNAFRSPDVFDPTKFSYYNGLSGAVLSDRLDDVGAFAGTSATASTIARELARVRFTATDGGMLTFMGDVTSVLLPAHATAIYGVSTAVPTSQIGFYRGGPALGTPLDMSPAFLNIVSPISADNDVGTIVEDTATGVIIPVLANDSTQSGTLQIQSIGTVTGGSAVVDNNGTPANLADDRIRFTPAANFNGTASFTYTISNGTLTDTATVTIDVTPVNDAPVVSGPTSLNTNEDAALTLSGANAMSMTDVDSGAADLLVTLTSSNGTLTLGSTAGLTGLTGDGTGSISFQGTAVEASTALNGLVFTPTSNFNGPVSITVTANDQGNTGGAAEIGTRTLNVTVVAQNDPPENIVPLAIQPVVEEADLVFQGANSITVVDVDAGESATPTVRSTLSVAFGTLSVVAIGHGASVTGSGSASVVIEGSLTQVNAALDGLTYRSNEGEFDKFDTLTILTTDLGHTGQPGAGTDTDTVTIDIESAVIPRARRDVATVAEDSADNRILVLANDRPTEGERPVFVSIITPPQHGTVSAAINDNGTPTNHFDDYLEYTPDDDYFGPDSFQYSINDTNGTGDDSTGTVDITVTNTPDAPVANDDSGVYTTNEDVALVIGAPGVLGNDVDVDGDTLTAVIVTQPTNGTVVLNGNGSFTYTPNANFNGPDSFTYRASDGTSQSTLAATVSINVGAIDDAPVANADAYQVTEDNSLSVPAASGVLFNDTDVESQSLTATIASQPANGTVTLNSDGSFDYTPNSNFAGTDTFTYTASDGNSNSVAGTVTITVNPVNDAPVAQANSYSTNEDVTLNVTLPASGVLGNDTDVDNATLTAQLVSGPTGGALTLNGNGTFSYVPAANFHGTDSFVYRAFDGTSASADVTVTITVTPVNDAPVAGPDAAAATEDAILSVNAATGVLANDSDVDSGDSISAVIATVQSAKGATVAIAADGSFTYNPATAAQLQSLSAGATTTDTFTYTVRDVAGLTATGTVTVTVTGQNDGPNAVDDASDGIANVAKPIHVLANDTDIDSGDTLTISAVQSTSVEGGTVTIGTGGNVVYTAPAGFEGTDSFTYTISDGQGGTDTATVTVTVVNFIPTDISGYVYIDRITSAQPTGDGVFQQGTERGVASVAVTISSPTGTDMFGDAFTPVTVMTDATGKYSFANIRPGTYEITQTQPLHLRDGRESFPASSNGFASVTGNDEITIALPQLGLAGGAHHNNFAELGIDASSLDDSRGLLQEMLASSSQNGLVISTNIAGDPFWFWALNNWSGLTSVDLNLSSNLATATLTATINGVQKTVTIGQQPNANGARFRILGSTTEGGYLIRLDGMANDFFAANSQASGEGEGQVDQAYAAGADAVFAEQNWA